MGVSLSPSSGPIPSAPNASFTPSNSPICNTVDILLLPDGLKANPSIDAVVAAIISVDDFILAKIGCEYYPFWRNVRLLLYWELGLYLER
mmetsp:Transcript_16958/g.33729  ORF Transcript_16958/g.33729 Transcript_16958/m.33729 type:complete len:90 (+) Transcript_16958:836-1105(+)